MNIRIRPITPSDGSWVTELFRREWHSERIVSRGRVHLADRLPGLVAEQSGSPVGLVTYDVQGNECELISLNSLEENVGIGTALLHAVVDVAQAAGCRRIWLITTNDNMRALRFYQKRGMHLVAVHVNALERSRQIKPEIPLVGLDGIPLRDEIELELLLKSR